MRITGRRMESVNRRMKKGKYEESINR